MGNCVLRTNLAAHVCPIFALSVEGKRARHETLFDRLHPRFRPFALIFRSRAKLTAFYQSTGNVESVPSVLAAAIR